MPIYKFLCNSCNNIFETLVFVGEKIICSNCHSGNLSKLPSVFSFHTPTKGSSEKISSKAVCSTCPPGRSCATCK